MKKIKELAEVISWIFSAIMMVLTTIWWIDVMRQSRETEVIEDEELC